MEKGVGGTSGCTSALFMVNGFGGGSSASLLFMTKGFGGSAGCGGAAVFGAPYKLE